MSALTLGLISIVAAILIIALLLTLSAFGIGKGIRAYNPRYFLFFIPAFILSIIAQILFAVGGISLVVALLQYLGVV